MNELRIFKFYDTDATGYKEYDISGDEYKRLLNACFRYSQSFSLLVDLREPKTALPLASIEWYRMPVTERVRQVYSHYGFLDKDAHNGYEIRHYLLCDEVKGVIEEIADSIYEWICGWGYTNPTDPAFYRQDGSALFYSVIHEGECTLVVKPEEIDDFINKSMWHLVGSGEGTSLREL